jgi:hypothetical protein
VAYGNRLPLDANVVGYWGFDEANETDPALDESQYGHNMVVTGSPFVLPARCNNGRQFNGSSTYSARADTALLKLTGDMTLIVWPTLDQVNSSGSHLRCILECGGTTSIQADNILYGLYVSDAGELIYRHEHGAGLVVEFKTTVATIKTGRYYAIVVVRSANVLTLYLDNKLTAWASATVDGASHPVGTAVTAPDGGTNALLTMGKSPKAVDGAFWYGTLDEVSIHNLARPYQPYLLSIYYKLTLSNSFYRLTAYNTVKSVAAAEMGGGSRWWVYERDQSLYAVRENTLGLFTPEVQLTTGGLQPNGTVAPGGTEKPTVVYDKANDLLVVAFIGSGRVYRLTAKVGDAPQTQAMPYTVDTAGIVKVRDSDEGIRLGAGAGSRAPLNDLAYTNRYPLKFPTSDSMGAGAGGGDTKELMQPQSSSAYYAAPGDLKFTGVDSFGLLWSWTNTAGFAVFTELYGVATRIGTVMAATKDSSGRTMGFFPITSRQYQRRYFVKPLFWNGTLRTVMSNIVEDLLATADIYDYRYPTSVVYNRNDDDPHSAPLGSGNGLRVGDFTPIYINRTPLKLPTADVMSAGGGAGLRVSTSNSASITAPQRRAFEVS